MLSEVDHQLVLGREHTGVERQRRHTLVHTLAHQVVLRGDELVELHDRGRVEVGAGDDLRGEHELHHERGEVRALGKQAGDDCTCAGDVDEHVGERSAPVVRVDVELAQTRQRWHGMARCIAGAVVALDCDPAVVAAQVDHPSGAVERDHGHQFRVHAGAVQALLVVLDDDLPVGGDVADAGVRDVQRTHVEALEREEVGAMGAQPLVERRRLFGQADEHEAMPLPNVVRPQRQARLVDIGVVEVRGGDQASVERVRPCVVGAHQRTLTAVVVLVAQPGAAVAAHVGQCMQRAIEIAREQHALAGKLDHGSIARLQAITTGREHPASVEDACTLDLVDLVGEVVVSCECASVVGQTVRHQRALPCFLASTVVRTPMNPERPISEVG